MYLSATWRLDHDFWSIVKKSATESIGYPPFSHFWNGRARWYGFVGKNNCLGRLGLVFFACHDSRWCFTIHTAIFKNQKDTECWWLFTLCLFNTPDCKHFENPLLVLVFVLVCLVSLTLTIHLLLGSAIIMKYRCWFKAFSWTLPC